MDAKIVIITNIPTPYRLPLWRSLSKLVDLNVICISAMEKNRHWKIDLDPYITILKSTHLFFHSLDWGLHFTVPFALTRELIKISPNVVIIAGYDNIQYWEALLYAKLVRKKVVFWNGSTLLSSRSKNKIVNYMKRFFIRRFDAYYTYGSKATEYLIHYGANPNTIITGKNTIDTDYFKINTANTSPNNGKLNFLYVGQLLERKGLENTLKAFSNLDRRDWILTIIGTGHDEVKLKNLVNELSLNNNVIFEGYKQKEEILTYFSNSDILIMPSYLEVWGLVLNEGLASGLFCLSSKYAGATFDLIEEGKNGFIIDPLDISSFSDSINRCFDQSYNKQEIKNSFLVSPQNQALQINVAIAKALTGI